MTHRRALPIAALVVGLAQGCPTPAGGVGGGSGGTVATTRVAGEPLVVQHLGTDATGAFVAGVPLPCAGARCLLVRSDVVAVKMDKGLWVRRAGDVDGQTLPLTPAPDEPAVVQALRSELAAAAAAAAAAAMASTTNLPPPPALSRGLRTCGTVAAGGGFGYHVIRNDGDVWQRIAWVTPPTATDVVALAPDAYPIVDPGAGGTLCAWGEQRRGERRWTVHHLGSETVVEAAANHEHVPARCRGEGRVDVETATGVVRIAADGSTGPLPDAGPSIAAPTSVLGLDSKAAVHIASGVVAVNRPDRTALDLDFKPGLAFDGSAVPPGLVRDRVLVAGDGKAHLAVVERFVGADRGLELLHVVRADGERPQVVSTPVRDDVVISRLAAGLDGFWWIEGPATVIRIGE